MEKKNIDWGNLNFGYIQTEKRYVSYFKDGSWDEGILTDDANIVLNECSGVLQYAQTIFEGLKAYTTEDGHIVAFRPDLNGERMEDSARRLEMPVFARERFVDAVAQVVAANAAYVPPYGSGATLYVRPYMFGVNSVIGVKPADVYQFRIFCTPVGPYFKGGVKPLTPDSGSAPAAGIPSDTADRALGDFGGRLLFQVRGAGENALVSPLSVLLCLSMCANGAQGETLQEFLDILGGGVDLDTLNASCASLLEDYLSLEGSTECNIAGSLWVDDRLSANADFLSRCTEYYRAGIYQADLDTQRTVDQVNAWVKEQTHGMIDGILDEPLTPDAVLLLANALYLKNTWANEFEAEDTGEQPFYTASGEEIQTEFLHNGTRSERYICTETERGVILPYDDGRLAFVALVPQDGDLSGYLAKWSGDTLPQVLSAAEDTLLTLSLPKFEAEWSGSLVEPLKALGLELPFDEERAQFGGVGLADGPLRISDALHKTRIEVNENGTEAAAVAAMIFAPTADMPFTTEPEVLILDRPFVYGIVDLERGIPLFLGTFETP